MAQYDLLLTQNVHATLTEYQEKFVNVSKGGLISANLSQEPTVLAGGTDGYVLARDDAEDTGLKWIDLSSITVTVANQANDRVITATATSNDLNAEQYLTYNPTQGLLIGSGMGIVFTAAATTYQIYTPSSAFKASISLVTGTNSAGGAGDVTIKAGAGTATGGNVYFQRDTTYGNFYFGTGSAGQLPAKSTETDVLYYDSTTGLVSYGASTASPWTRTGSQISPTTAGDDILLSSNEHIRFEGTTNVIYGGIGTLEYIIVYNTSVTMHFDETQILAYRNFKVATGNTKTYDLGASDAWWKDAYVDRLYIDDANTYIDIDTGDMTFTDTNSGTVTLASLAGGGAPAYGADTQIPFMNGTTAFQYSGDLVFTASALESKRVIRCITGTSYSNVEVYGFSNYYSNIQKIVMNVAEPDGASALPYWFDTANALTTSGAKLFELRNNAVSKFYVDKDGAAYSNGTLLTGGGGVTVGTTTQIPYSNVAGDDFDYSASFIFNTDGRVSVSAGFVSSALGVGTTNAIVYASGSGVGQFKSTANFIFNGTNALTIGDTYTTSTLNLGASGSSYNWEFKHDTDSHFKLIYFGTSYLDVYSTQTVITGGTTTPTLELIAGSSIVSAELGRHPSSAGQYYDGGTAATVDGSLYRSSGSQANNYTMFYHYGTTYGGMFHHSTTNASDLRIAYNSLEWGMGTTTTAWRGSVRMTANYIQVKGNSGSTTAFYMDGFGSGDDSTIFFREGTTTKISMGWDSTNTDFVIAYGTSLAATGRLVYANGYLMYLYGETSAGFYIKAATDQARFYLEAALNDDAIIHFREGSTTSQYVMGLDGTLGTFQIHSGTAFTTTAAADFSINSTGYVFMGNLRSVNNTPALRYNTGTGEVTYYSSDARMKKNIRPFAPSGLETLTGFTPKTYEWNEFEGTNHGWIAQEGVDLIPSMFPLVKKTGMYMLSETEILPYMHKAILELNDKIKDLTKQLAEK